MGGNLIIDNCKIVLLDEVIKNGYLLILDGKIHEVGFGDFFTEKSNKDKKYKKIEYLDARGRIIMPGFIDIHTHGLYGHGIMDSSISSCEEISKKLLLEGTTSFLATTLTDSYDKLTKTLSVTSEYINSCAHKNEDTDIAADMIGIHLEGPFINKEYSGFQNKEYIQKPSVELFKKYQSAARGYIKYVTIAPEHDEGFSLIKYLSSKNIVASAGHSAAKFVDIKNARHHGLKSMTHFYNAMSKLHHREAGCVGAGLYFDDIYLEMICDGIHISPETVAITYKMVDYKKIIMITDSMSLKGQSDGTYTLEGSEVVKSGNILLNQSGSLSGSVLHMNEAIKNFTHFNDINLKDISDVYLIQISAMTSSNVARLLNIPNKGKIAVNTDADLVLLDEQLNLNLTIKSGYVVKSR